MISRRGFLASSASVALPLVSCGHIASFDVAQDISQQTVQGSPLGAILPSFLPQPFPINIDVKAETAKRDTGPASSVVLSSISFSITAPQDGNFDFVDEIHIYVETTAQSALPRVEIASLSPVPKGEPTIPLKVAANVDLLPYINAGATISATANGHQPAQDTTFDGHIVVTINI